MISIIVSTYNRELYVLQCLEHIARQTESRVNWELVIVNNNCSDNTGYLIEGFLKKYRARINVSYHIENSQGLSYARNRGIKEAKGDFLVFIDDDAFLESNYVSELLTYLKEFKNSQGLAFGGKIKPYLESPLPSWMSTYLMPLMSVIDLGDKVKEFKKNKYPIGANMGFSRLLIDKVGDFNIDLGRVGKNTMGGEEKDLFFRIKKEKAKIYYFPKLEVQHVVPDARLTKPFIKKLALGIGKSERVRSQSIGSSAYLKSVFLELLKWGASFYLGLVFLLKNQFPKAKMILKFRWWVSKGLLFNK
jgi:glucosyl-dolichyl phosphate glucuronosyltransferase